MTQNKVKYAWIPTVSCLSVKQNFQPILSCGMDLKCYMKSPSVPVGPHTIASILIMTANSLLFLVLFFVVAVVFILNFIIAIKSDQRCIYRKHPKQHLQHLILGCSAVYCFPINYWSKHHFNDWKISLFLHIHLLFIKHAIDVIYPMIRKSNKFPAFNEFIVQLEKTQLRQFHKHVSNCQCNKYYQGAVSPGILQLGKVGFNGAPEAKQCVNSTTA